MYRVSPLEVKSGELMPTLLIAASVINNKGSHYMTEH